MTGRPFLPWPNKRLRTAAAPVDASTDEIRAIWADMVETMEAMPGIGLAAPQVALPWRMFVAHVPVDPENPPPPPLTSVATEEPTVYINPVLHYFSRDLEPYDEGCLSLPEIAGTGRRPSQVSITATDLNGKRSTVRGAGLLARCWQHEMDHLEGTLIIDKFSPMDKRRAKRALKDLEAAARPIA